LLYHESDLRIEEHYTDKRETRWLGQSSSTAKANFVTELSKINVTAPAG
jgi:hypothetical protein